MTGIHVNYWSVDKTLQITENFTTLSAETHAPAVCLIPDRHVNPQDFEPFYDVTFCIIMPR